MDTRTPARRFLEEPAAHDRESVYAHHCTADYTEHDPNMEQETMGPAEATRLYREVRDAFEVTHTAQSLVAEGDLVRARFLIHGRHTGDYRGNPPSGRAFETTGHVTLRIQHGRIAESWFNYDLAGALEQVGAPPATGP